jgi:HK97 family phage prohead protease
MHKPVIKGAREERLVRVEDLELRADDGASPIITGHPLVYGKWSDDLGGFRERILPGAATKTIGESDIRALFNHDPNFVIGRTRSGTLELSDQAKGVAMRATPPATTWATDLVTSMRRGDIDQMSFAFTAIRDEWREPKKDGDLFERDIAELRMYDVSVVTFPAYVQTDAQVRSAMESTGLDFDALAAFLTRAQRGLTPTSSDLDLIEASVAALRSYIPPAPDPAPEPETTQASPDAGRSLGHLRALLALEAAHA